MKKFGKFLLIAAGVCAGVVGGLFVYNKFKENNADYDDDLDDDFDYDDDFDDDEEPSYVDISAANEADSEDAE